MRKIIGIIVGLLKGVWFTKFSKKEYMLFHILTIICCGTLGVSSLLFDGLYFPWINLKISAIGFGIALTVINLFWMVFASLLPLKYDRTHAGQIFISGGVGFSFCCTMLLIQERPLWALALFIAGILLGLHIPAAEYRNRQNGGYTRTRKVQMHSILRRANTLIVCMSLAWFLLRLDHVTVPDIECNVREAVTDNGIVVTDTHWESLDEGERYQLLKLILSEQCSENGIDSPALTIDELPENTLGAFYRENYAIILNKQVLSERSASTCVYVLLHEFRHCWQYSLTQSSGENLSVEQQLLADAFSDNLENYMTSAQNGYEAYYSQFIEADARQYTDRQLENYYTFPTVIMLSDP